jgi:hypothetical protein
MLSIQITQDAEQRLRELLQDNDYQFVRVKSFTVGKP